MKAPLTAEPPEDAHEPEPPPRGASMFSATINLANSILGAGTLAIPYAFAGSGVASGLIFALLTAFLSVLSLPLLLLGAELTGRPASLYSVCGAAWPGLSLLVDACVCYGGTIGASTYLIIATDSLEKVFGGSRAVWTLLAVLTAAPLALLRHVI